MGVIKITIDDLKCPCCGGNEAKPAIVDLLNQFQDLLGRRPVITSGYRCPKHNAEVGGATNSMHLLGLAADIASPPLKARTLENFARRCNLLKGFGRNDFHNFIHIDARSTSADWCYDKDGKQVPYYS